MPRQIRRGFFYAKIKYPFTNGWFPYKVNHNVKKGHLSDLVNGTATLGDY